MRGKPSALSDGKRFPSLLFSENGTGRTGYLTKMALAERQTRKSENPVLKFCGVLSKGEADRMSAAVAE